jgi:hypothetical protein
MLHEQKFLRPLLKLFWRFLIEISAARSGADSGLASPGRDATKLLLKNLNALRRSHLESIAEQR